MLVHLRSDFERWVGFYDTVFPVKPLSSEQPCRIDQT